MIEITAERYSEGKLELKGKMLNKRLVAIYRNFRVLILKILQY